MKIESINIFQVDLPLHKPFAQSGGRVLESEDSTIVAIHTDSGLVGWGESCPWGSDYLPAFAEGIRAALSVMAPVLLGMDPLNISTVNAAMDKTLRGQEAAKHAIDLACWDLLGKSAQLPLFSLLGGRVSENPTRQGLIEWNHGREAMAEQILSAREEGRPMYELKATGDVARDIEHVSYVTSLLEPHESLKVDANGGWTPVSARAVMAVAPEMNIQYEQPCAEIDQIRALRRLTDRPIYLDEGAVTLSNVANATTEGLINGVNVKIGRVGGMSKARAMRDLCIGLGLPIFIQCMGGSEISSAAIAHLAHSTPPGSLISIWSPTAVTPKRVATGLELPADAAVVRAGDAPGLGIEPIHDVLGEPVATYE